MIKVYLDWNCITHSKDCFVKLKELLEQFSGVFICPYSEAHLRDVQTKCDVNIDAYNEDLDLLTQICRGNMFDLKENKLKLYKVDPRDYLLQEGDTIDFIQNKFSFPYEQIKQIAKDVIPSKDYRSISCEEDPLKVIPKINSIISRGQSVDCDIVSLLDKFNTSGINGLEMKIKQLYYMLDLMGYKSEKKHKSFANIDTDAQHIAMASLCDYLISNDSKLRGKAKAIYSQCNCVTKVKDPMTFIDEIPQIVECCYDEELIPNAIKDSNLFSLREDGLHLKALEYPLWGTFKFCCNATALNDTLSNSMAFFLPGTFMFYDELEQLAFLISLGTEKSKRELLINRFMLSYTQSNNVENFAFVLSTANSMYDCLLTTFDGLPALQVTLEHT